MNKIIKSLEIYSKFILEMLEMMGKIPDFKYNVVSNDNSLMITVEKKFYTWKHDKNKLLNRKLETTENIIIQINYNKKIHK